MRIHNLYTDEKGQSHFRDIEVEFVEERRGSKLSRRLPANGIIFRVSRASMISTGTRRRAGNTSSISTPASRSPRATARHARSAPAKSSWSRT